MPSFFAANFFNSAVFIYVDRIQKRVLFSSFMLPYEAFSVLVFKSLDRLNVTYAYMSLTELLVSTSGKT